MVPLEADLKWAGEELDRFFALGLGLPIFPDSRGCKREPLPEVVRRYHFDVAPPPPLSFQMLRPDLRPLPKPVFVRSLRIVGTIGRCGAERLAEGEVADMQGKVGGCHHRQRGRRRTQARNRAD